MMMMLMMSQRCASKLGRGDRKSAEASSLETTSSTASGSTDKVSRPLFYLTKVRGISDHHNRSDVAI